MAILNLPLFNSLKEVFGKVGVSKKGVQSSIRVKDDPFTNTGPLLAANNYKVVYGDWGETYTVCCPKCGDTRSRLYISHMWGVELKPGVVLKNLVKCFNEDCNWVDLDDHIRNKALLCGLKQVRECDLDKSCSRPAKLMSLPSSPEHIHFLSELEPEHPAVRYTAYRGLDPDFVSKAYGVSYCNHSNWKTPVTDSTGKVWYRTPQDRLIIPNLDGNGSWNGWQARWIGGYRLSDDISTWDKVPKDPTLGKELLPKYLSAPGMSAKGVVFNVGRAASLTDGKLCFVSEGPMSAIASGPCGVCTFGMRLSEIQIDLICKHFEKGKVFILAESEDDPVASCRAINARVKGGCRVLRLPPKQGAADLGFEGVLDLVSKQPV